MISFEYPPTEGHHVCQAKRVGDFIVFTCILCPGYERKINVRTREMEIKTDDPTINHCGSWSPPEFRII